MPQLANLLSVSLFTAEMQSSAEHPAVRSRGHLALCHLAVQANGTDIDGGRIWSADSFGLRKANICLHEKHQEAALRNKSTICVLWARPGSPWHDDGRPRMPLQRCANNSDDGPEWLAV